MTGGAELRVVLEAGSLVDGRATAGIGRYVRSLAAALDAVPGLRLTLSVPPRAAPSERHPLRYAWAQPWLVGSALRVRPQVVHAVTSEPVLGWPLRRQVVTVHDVVPWTVPGFARGPVAAYFAVQRRRLRRCAAIITVSPSVAADVVAALGIRPGRVHVVPEGVGAPFTPAPAADDEGRRERCGARPPYILWTGSLRAHDPRKALDVLVEAMAAVTAALPGTGLVLAGRRGVASDRVRELAAGLSPAPVFTDFVSDADLAALYRGAAAAVVPSLHEGFGLPVLEAMACAAPVVASRAGNLPELAGDGALLVPPGDAAALAGALVEVVRGGGDELRRRGPLRAREFTWERAARETAAVYREVASGRTA